MPAGGLGTAALIGGGLAGVSAIGKGIAGLFQGKKADNIDKTNPYPTMVVQPGYYQNLAQAEQQAKVGIPQQQYQGQLNAISRNQASGIQALSRTQNPSGSVASIVRAGNDASNNLNSQDAIERNRNLLNLMQQRQTLAQQQQGAWDWNSRQKYLGLLAKSQALRGASMQNLNGAFNDLSSAGSALISSGIGGSQRTPNVNGAGAGVPIGSGYVGDINPTGMFNNMA
jgi:hypothetical protein